MNLLNYSMMLPFLVLIFSLFSPAKPDAALIENLCRKTEQPVICSDCLNSGSGSQTADGRGLALIAIGCTERDTRVMAQRLDNLYQNTPPSKLKTLLNDCWLWTEYAAVNFQGIARLVAAGDYAGGENVLENSLRIVNRCLAEFDRNPSVPVPSDVLAGSLAAAQGCQIIFCHHHLRIEMELQVAEKMKMCNDTRGKIRVAESTEPPQSKKKISRVKPSYRNLKGSSIDHHSTN